MLPKEWTDYKIGIGETPSSFPTFAKKEWDEDGKNIIGMKFSELAILAIQRSRFHPTMHDEPPWIQGHQGGIIRTMFRLFNPNPHELPGTERVTGSGDSQYWVTADVNPAGELTRYNPFTDVSLRNSGYAIGLGSRVELNNLTLPGTFGGWGHFPMLDLVKPPTPHNVDYIIESVLKRTRLRKFWILRSSDHGMMLFSPEIIDEAHLLAFWDEAELINHYEVDRDDYWVDSRWLARSRQNQRELIETPNNLQVCGILRLNASPPLKPEEPVVVAASF